LNAAPVPNDPTGAVIRGGTRAVVGWCLFDWANSAFPTVINTFVFATYFTSSVASDPVSGTSAWGYANTIAGVLIALLSPPLGAIADRGGGSKPMLALFVPLTGLFAASLWFVEPDPGWVLPGLALYVAGTISFELGTVFYNSMLPRIADPSRIGRISGWGWGVGYIGGLACLVLCLMVLIQPDPAPFGLDRTALEHVRATSLVVGAWTVVFAIPLFLYVPGQDGAREPWGQAIRNGMGAILRLLPELRRRPDIARFLLARLFYTDGLNTLFAFGAIYAAGTFGMATDEIILLGIVLNVTAGAGAAGFAFLDDRLGPKPVVLVALAGLALIGAGLLVAPDKTWFWILAAPLGLFFGPAQAASRTLMAKLAPPDQQSEFFGLFALSGRITSFMGPAVLATVTAWSGSQRAGMSTILVFLALGAAILLTVRPPARAAA